MRGSAKPGLVTNSYSTLYLTYALKDVLGTKRVSSLLIGLLAVTLVTAGIAGMQQVAAAKKSYKLIVYLDGAFKPNNLPSFKVVVYNSDHKKILSDKVTPNFSDSHQKISPKSGYKIVDKAKQHPSQIEVCAQQVFSIDSKAQTHDDCFDIKQNKAKTYWYSIFDYPLLEGFEGD